MLLREINVINNKYLLINFINRVNKAKKLIKMSRLENTFIKMKHYKNKYSSKYYL